MLDATANSGWICYAISQRDGAYAFETLQRLAASPDAPDLAVAERLLVERGDDLCDLAVATFGRDAVSVDTLYRRTTNPLLRLAILANSYYRATGWAGSVLDLDQATAMLARADRDELQAFFGNPRLSPDGLLDVLLRQGPAVTLAADHPAWPLIFDGLSANDSLGDLFDTRRVLPGAAERYRMNAALIECLRCLTPSHTTASAIADMLVALLDLRSPGSTFMADDLTSIILHWHPSPAADASAHPCFRVQMLLSILYTWSDTAGDDNRLPATRAASMAKRAFRSDLDMSQACDADPAAFFAGVPFHSQLYEDAALGMCFVSLALSRNESAYALYQSRRSKFDRLRALDRPATLRDVMRLRDELAESNTGSASLTEMRDLQREWLRASQEHSSARDKVASRPSAWRTAGWVIVVMLLLLLVAIAADSLFRAHPGFRPDPVSATPALSATPAGHRIAAPP